MPTGEGVSKGSMPGRTPHLPPTSQTGESHLQDRAGKQISHGQVDAFSLTTGQADPVGFSSMRIVEPDLVFPVAGEGIAEGFTSDRMSDPEHVFQVAGSDTSARVTASPVSRPVPKSQSQEPRGRGRLAGELGTEQAGSESSSARRAMAAQAPAGANAEDDADVQEPVPGRGFSVSKVSQRFAEVSKDVRSTDSTSQGEEAATESYPKPGSPSPRRVQPVARQKPEEEPSDPPGARNPGESSEAREITTDPALVVPFVAVSNSESVSNEGAQECSKQGTPAQQARETHRVRQSTVTEDQSTDHETTSQYRRRVTFRTTSQSDHSHSDNQPGRTAAGPSGEGPADRTGTSFAPKPRLWSRSRGIPPARERPPAGPVSPEPVGRALEPRQVPARTSPPQGPSRQVTSSHFPSGVH